MLNSLLKPHIFVKNLNHINFQYLHETLNIHYILLDKSDTFTQAGKTTLHKDLEVSQIKDITHLYKDKIYVVSNSKKTWEIDWRDGELEREILQHKAFRRIETRRKKPFNGNQVERYFRDQNLHFDWKQAAYIGDQFVTDVGLARFNRAFSILVRGFPDSERIPNKVHFIVEKYFFDKDKLDSICRKSFNGIEISEEVFRRAN